MRCVFVPAFAFAAALLVGNAAAAEPSAANGRVLFVKVGCYQCHGYQGQGGAAGPRIAPEPLPFDGQLGIRRALRSACAERAHACLRCRTARKSLV